MQHETARRSNRDRTEATRADLIRAARKLFTEKSYAETGTPEIVAAAGVTRGALYHHFADKQALFAAVVEQEAAMVAAEVDHASPDSLSAREALIAGSDAYLAAMREPGRTRMLLIDGPAVLGRAAMDEIDNRHGNRSLREGLVAAMRAQSVIKLPAEALTALLAAAFDRAALAIEAGASAKDYRTVLLALMDGLSPAPPPSTRPAPSR
ncbi:MAG: TetR/AcrR family transcriptional regulator [Mesorhizobium sp.]|uniref:TetR/AcrR family transcriptional regulator n=1 Tax=Mesorhizobium sp. TaxID=1871066 RepID=UPI000FEA9100|nr:TetR/AcrR family transcriptional regulator [Mesorhizobium sp.]RWD66518.1 MAG: TetR/AcrR family transcriptional regulator [Mesorhizobium sp.]RWE40596.1 MAG: TetR/AcrR family transcriptional regulator [Mesorhizobium sp.]